MYNYRNFLAELAQEAIKRRYDVCTRSRLKIEGKGDYHIDLRIRGSGGGFVVIFLGPCPSSNEFGRVSRIVADAYPLRVLILNIDGIDYTYHLSQMARAVTVNRAEFWDAVDSMQRSECPHGQKTDAL